MNKPLLVIGNRNYSSWSLRAWLALAKSGVDFDIKRLALDTPQFHAEIGRYSPSRRVPVLVHGGFRVWDSLAIAEYVNEVFAAGRLWPRDVVARGHARAVSAEMHSGFMALRTQMPMNCRATGRRVPMTPELERDIERVGAIWQACRTGFGQGGPWLYGAFTIADAMYAPIIFRLRTYCVALTGEADVYATTVLGDGDVRGWTEQAALEPETVEADEAGR